jgi:DNA-binding CsgD family transcriptional regulator
MQAEMEIQGEDVVGVPGQALTWRELRVLVGLADGENPNTIAAAINADKVAIRYIEASIKAKLGAKTHPHMIARGFTLGVLFPRALCVLLAFLCVTEGDFDAVRNRTPSRSRAPSSYTRLTRAGSGSRSGGSRSTTTSATSIAARGGLVIFS